MLLLDGKALNKKRLAELKKNIEADFVKINKRPGLAVIRIGDDQASKVYVSRKIKTCEDVGILSVEEHLPKDVEATTVLNVIKDFNEDPKIHGILVQLPLPDRLDQNEILEAVHPRKDIDGFHPINIGRFISGQDAFVPCTPKGVMSLLEEYKIELKGKRAVVVGRSVIVGRPMSILLDKAGATVTVVHSKTNNPAQIMSEADVLVVAVGKPGLVKAEEVAEGAVVIDVGINRLETGKLVGDVDFESVKDKASAITPVPGGVGPMTICSLMENTYKSFKFFEF